MTNKLGFWSIILLGINTILGSGIFLLPGSFYIALNERGIFPTLIVIATVLSISLCFAEASGIFEGYGGPYIYVREAMGEFMGFQVGFMKWVISLLAWATMAVAFADLLVAFLDIGHIPYIEKILAGLLIIILSYINFLGVELTKSLNNIVSLGKMVPILLFVFIGIKYIGQSNLLLITRGPEGLITGIKDPILILFYAFTGFESIAVAARDMKTPLKNLPKGIIGVMIGITILYLILIFSILGILGRNIDPDSYPIFHAAYLLLGPLGGSFFSSGIIMSIIGINIASSFTSPRSIVALSEKKTMPEFLSRKNKYGTPGAAIILTGGLSLLIILIGNFNTLVSFSVISRISQYLLTCVAVIIFKKRGIRGSLVLPGGYLIPLIALVTMGILFYNYLIYIASVFLIFFLIGKYFYSYDGKSYKGFRTNP
ncbi:APC family permease [Psychrilyobacter atlanticus]|uniref:APC family permease n=1 Tax=Psychrilyobacter atlanticus TaxID=271091 RepID=UPI000412525A|nr:APC family permease [Psychrilyobacter atlanticus]